MKTLYSENKLEDYEHLILSLDSVYWQLDEAAMLDGKFRKSLENSLIDKGMLWPPIVWTQQTFEKHLESGGKIDSTKEFKTNKPYRVAIGNNRFDFASNHGYTHIECVAAKEPRDKKDILKMTEMHYYVDF